MRSQICPICGGDNYTHSTVLGPQLIADWQLSKAEVSYIDDQQGCCCNGCGASLRVVALGNAIRAAFGSKVTLRQFVTTPEARHLRLLDINGSDALSPTLAVLPGYVRGDYPTIDIHQLPFRDGSFDVVIHSDTLEHVSQPVRALEECRRVLAPGGRLCFTIPIIVGRMTRNRDGLAKSYHGDPSVHQDDFIVHYEFGADAWCYVMQAGFTHLTLNQVAYPTAIAISAWYEISDLYPPVRRPMSVYEQDGLRSIHNHDFMEEPEFKRAYGRGIKAVGYDYHWHWRVHVGLWAAISASKISGDYVECGVNRGFMSSAIMELLHWDTMGRTFYLLDSFAGIDKRYISDYERREGVVLERNARDIESGFYTFDVDRVRDNFSEWKNIEIIVGSIPETLSEIKSTEIAFLHIDLNCSLPEVATMEALWNRLSPGAFILFDDYAYDGYYSQKIGMDEWAARNGVFILSLPTGQGLLIKPATSTAADQALAREQMRCRALIKQIKGPIDPSFEGNVDAVSNTEVRGWCCAGAIPDERVLIIVSRGDHEIASALADQWRPDLLAARKGDGAYGFNIALPPASFGLAPLKVLAQTADGATWEIPWSGEG